jgi:hypothetical protein
MCFYCFLFKAREGSRSLSGKAQEFVRLVTSKSVSSSQSLRNSVNRSRKCSFRTQKRQGTVVQIVFIFDLLVVPHDKLLHSVEEQDCKLCIL